MKKIIILLCIPFFFIRCDSFLDVNPDSEVVNKDMFNTASGVEDALYGVYMTMATKDMYGRLMSTMIPEILGQNFTSTYQYLPYLGRFEYERSETRNMYKNIWKTSYLTISYLNNIIENLEEKSEKDFRHYNLYMGEALGLRAAIHFDLLRFFAVHITSTNEAAKAKAIPYVTEYDFKVTPYSSVEEAYGKIITELKRAEGYLTEDESLMPANRVGNEKGFTGAIYITNKATFDKYSNKGVADSKKIQGDKNTVPLKTSVIELASQAHIYTDVLKKSTDAKLDMSGLYKGEVSIVDDVVRVGLNEYMGKGYNDPYGHKEKPKYSTTYVKGKIRVTVESGYNQHDLYTVESIQNYLGVHEYYGHGIMNWSKTSTHWKCYNAQLNHPTFKKLPKYQQDEIKERYNLYYSKRGK